MDGDTIQTRSYMLWGLSTSAVASFGTRDLLCMLGDENCRTAGFGKTERPVRWEGDGEAAVAGAIEALPSESAANR